MTRFARSIPTALGAALALLVPAVAEAQMPTGQPPGGTIGEEDTKPEGAAEKAPEEPGQLPSMPTMPPYPGQRRKQFQIFELDGYYRLRTDWFSNFNLGFHSDLPSGAPFREALSCLDTADPGAQGACSDTIGSANMRLRLEPIINLSEKVSVHATIDVLDNVVLGATPDGVFFNGGEPANIPINAFSGGQVAPEAGRNYAYDSVRVKRAWAEVMTPLGLLRFGRMPSHWGLGLLANSGADDPFHANNYCLDCDFGDHADRVIFGTKIPGTRFRAAVGMDWGSSEPTAGQTSIWANRYEGQPWDLDDADDVRQWLFVLADFDSPDEWTDKIQLGETAINWGVYLVYRAQDYEAIDLTLDSTSPEANLRRRGAWAYIPDLYFRLGHKKLNVEAEAVVIYGGIDDLSDVSDGVVDQTILQMGGVARVNYLMVDDTLNLGFEVGYASGDQWEALTSGVVNVRDVPAVPQDPSDTTISNFRFDFDYHVDLILFRELIGTVTNATYLKPSLAYDLTDRLKFRAASIISFANVPVATPGNGNMYGVELDGDLGYHNDDEGFFAGISYGVFFPLDAMDHPTTLFPSAEAGDASTAQTIQTRLVVKF